MTTFNHKNKVYLCLYKGPVPISSLETFIDWMTHYFICILTMDFVSHTEVCINTQSYSSSMKDRGVRDKHINFSDGRWIVYETDADHIKAIAVYDKLKGKKYDVGGVLAFVFRMFRHSSNKLFCSEICSDMLGLPNPILNTPTYRNSPGSLRVYCKKMGYKRITDLQSLKTLSGL